MTEKTRRPLYFYHHPYTSEQYEAFRKAYVYAVRRTYAEREALEFFAVTWSEIQEAANLGNIFGERASAVIGFTSRTPEWRGHIVRWKIAAAGRLTAGVQRFQQEGACAGIASIWRDSTGPIIESPIYGCSGRTACGSRARVVPQRCSSKAARINAEYKPRRVTFCLCQPEPGAVLDLLRRFEGN